VVSAAMALLGTTLAPASASAEEGEAAEARVLATELHPGWNMVGWLGPETPVTELFSEMPTIREVWAWDTSTQRYHGALRDSPDGLRTLTPGLGFWLYLSGDATVAWERPVAAESVVLTLQEGANLVAWPGQGAPLRETLAGLGASLVLAAGWNAEHQRFDLHIPEAPDAFNTLPALTAGDAIWVEVSGEAYWWVPGTDRPRFEFDTEVEAEEREAMTRSVEEVMDLFDEHFGVVTTDFLVSVSAERGCGFAPGRIRVWSSSTTCLGETYFGVLQWHLAEGANRGPAWLVAGSRKFADAVYRELLRAEGNEDTGYARTRQFAVFHSLGVTSLDEPSSRAPYLGFLAAEWLADHAGHSALTDYFRRLPSSPGWESAFEGAFGISIDDFYTTFEAYRAEVAPRVPHLNDDVVRPVIEFLGDVPEETRAAIQAELDSVTMFFTDDLGAEPVDYSLYVAKDSDAARATYDRINIFGWPPELMCIQMHVLDCRFSLDYQDHIQAQVLRLLLNKEHGDPLYWITYSRPYLESRFLRATGQLTAANYAGVLRQQARTVEQFSVPLHHLQSREGWVAAEIRKREALAFLALDWLGRHAGDDALIEYYRLLPIGYPSAYWYEPNAGSWQAAFEQAFGLTIEDFYEAFAAYRETLQPD